MADLPTQRDFKDYPSWRGREVRASDGMLGHVDAIYLDEATGAPEWVLVRLDGEDRPSAFVPLVGAEIEASAISVEPDRDRIGGAPHVGEGDEDTLTVAEERRLYEHYGLAYSDEDSASLLPEDALESKPADQTDPPVTEATADERPAATPMFDPDPAGTRDAQTDPPATPGPTGALPDPVHAPTKPRLRRFVDIPQDPSPAAPAAETAQERSGSLLSRVPLPAVIGAALALAAAAVAVVLRRRS